MSGDERTLLDASGDYRYAVRDGEPVADDQWRSCRLMMTDRRLVLADSDGKQTVAHSQVELLETGALPEGTDPGRATPLRIGEHVVLVAGVADFEREYCRATLHGEVILANAPAVVGGVREDAEWSKARFHLAEDEITVEFPDGGETVIDVADVGTVETERREVAGETRTVLAVEHTDADGRRVETHLSGMDHHTKALRSLFETVIAGRADESDELDETERRVLVALYSGVSPFEMADFVGCSVEEVETIYQHLLEVGAVDEVRTRTEVTLNAQGRNMASEAMNEE